MISVGVSPVVEELKWLQADSYLPESWFAVCALNPSGLLPQEVVIQAPFFDSFVCECAVLFITHSTTHTCHFISNALAVELLVPTYY